MAGSPLDRGFGAHIRNKLLDFFRPHAALGQNNHIYIELTSTQTNFISLLFEFFLNTNKSEKKFHSYKQHQKIDTQ